MKIAINAHMLAFPSLRGWNRYTANLIAALSKLGVDLNLYSDLPIHETHRARLMERLGIHDLPSLIRLAMRAGLIPPAE